MNRLATRTKHRQRGTQLLMAPEQLHGKCQIKQAEQDDLMKVDILQFGMTLFFLRGDINCPTTISI